MNQLLYGIEYLSDSEQKRLFGNNTLGKGASLKENGKNVYEIITEKIVKIIEKSEYLPWRKPWSINQTGEPNYPLNFSTKKHYSGVNLFVLSMEMDMRKHQCPYFMTFKQVSEMKGTVKKGAVSYQICFYTNDLYRNVDTGRTITKTAWEKLPNSEKGNFEPSFTLKFYNAFNAADIDGIDFGDNWKPRTLKDFEQIESCENIVYNMPNKPPITEVAQDKAFYMPSTDSITMPLRGYFERPQEFYSTLFHEMIHATGSENRLDRQEKKKRKAFGDSFYSYEELIAEMGACYLCGESGILYFTLDNSVAYLKSWKSKVINYLSEDPKFFFKAAADAQRGADYILGKSDPTVYARFFNGKSTGKPQNTSLDLVKAKAKALKLKALALNL